jgi:hypothetical protein
MPKEGIAEVVAKKEEYYGTTYDKIYHPLYKNCLQDSKEGVTSLFTQVLTTQVLTTQVHPTTTTCLSCTAPPPEHGLQRYCAASHGVASTKKVLGLSYVPSYSTACLSAERFLKLLVSSLMPGKGSKK